MTIAVAALASIGAVMARPPATKQSACDMPASQVDGLRKAFFFAFPLYEMTRMRQRMLSAPGAMPNSLQHRTGLSRPADRAITTPNTDTLYSSAWLDLSAGPVAFSIPPMGKRYHSAELMNAFSDAFAMLRNESETARVFLIAGPGWDGDVPPGATVVRSPTRDAWLVIRTIVEGPADLAEAQARQQAYRLVPTGITPAAVPTDAPVSLKPGADDFLRVVNSALARGPLPPEHAERLPCFASAGLAAGDSGPLEGSSAALEKAWNAGIEGLYDEARQAFETAGSLHGGWRYPAANIAQFGTDDIYRSAMALGGLAAMPLAEALNPVATTDAGGQVLNGARRYRLRIPGKVPVEGFWSLTLYEAGGSGRWFLYDNPIDRYAISASTTGLHQEPDGGLVIDIAHRQIDGAANWLPAPAGEFMLVFRAYRPHRALIDGTFRLPPIEPDK